jgi:hypothetical protein
MQAQSHTIAQNFSSSPGLLPSAAHRHAVARLPQRNQGSAPAQPGSAARHRPPCSVGTAGGIRPRIIWPPARRSPLSPAQPPRSAGNERGEIQGRIRARAINDGMPSEPVTGASGSRRGRASHAPRPSSRRPDLSPSESIAPCRRPARWRAAGSADHGGGHIGAEDVAGVVPPIHAPP